MPELPEVETVKRSLEPVVLNKEIESVTVLYERIIQGFPLADFQAIITNNKFLALERRGKYLLFYLEGDWVLVAHLRMTGRLLYLSNEDEVPLAKHTSVIFKFAEGDGLRFEDVRKFATLNLVRKGEYESIKGLYTLGVEPLEAEFSMEYFQAILKNRQGRIKGLLLDQTKIAGIGNIYADESLFLSGIHPERTPASLSEQEQKRLHANIKKVLAEAILGQGTTLKDYRTGYGQEGSFQNKLLIYGKKGEACPKCGQAIEHKKVVGRTSHYCPNCQRREL